MAVDQILGQPWTRKHDDPAKPIVPSAPRTMFPKSLEELIEICSKRAPKERVRAAGSHWALSEAAVADSIFVETHDPNNLFQAMEKTLFEVVPGRLHDDFIALMAAMTQPAYDQNSLGENVGFYL